MKGLGFRVQGLGELRCKNGGKDTRRTRRAGARRGASMQGKITNNKKEAYHGIYLWLKHAGNK
jgi:hypothetical protein